MQKIKSVGCFLLFLQRKPMQLYWKPKIESIIKKPIETATNKRVEWNFNEPKCCHESVSQAKIQCNPVNSLSGCVCVANVSIEKPYSHIR